MEIAKLFRVFFVLLLSACTATQSFNVRIHADQELNPNVDGKSLPVRLKIYELNDPTLFSEATFQQLWKNDADILTHSLLNKKEITIIPGESTRLKMSHSSGAEYLAVIGVFRQHDDNGWKALKPLPHSLNAFFNRIAIVIKRYSVEII